MKLVYWKCKCTTDHDAYSIRARTRREAYRLYRLAGGKEQGFLTPRKIVVEFKDEFDLVNRALGEGGIE